MCSRYMGPGYRNDIDNHYKIKLGPEHGEWKSLIYPGYQAPVIIGGSAELAAEVRFWGFIARFPGKRDPNQMLEKIMQNAVSETIDEKRTFSSAWKKNQRCVIPVVHFLEPVKKVFTPIHDPSRPIMSIAGIWGDVTYKGEKRPAFTMLTCEPNKFIEPHHDRMPVILSDYDVDEWLSPDTTSDQASKLLKPYRGKLKFAT